MLSQNRRKFQLINDLTWTIPYLVVDITGLSPGRQVLIPRQGVEWVDWPTRKIIEYSV
jgi:hypothetical protein